MEIKREGEKTILSFELVEAQSKLDCGISLESFFKRRAEKFEFGENDYYNMVKKEIEYINQNTEAFVDYDLLGRPFWTLDNISLKDAKKIIDDLQKLNIQINEPPPKPFAGIIKSLKESQQDFLFNHLKESSFLHTETDYESFCFVFGNSIKPDKFRPLQWLQNKQLLRELITELKHPNIEITKNKYILPAFFIDEKKNTILYLPTNKPKNDILSNKIVEISKKLRQTK